MTVKIPHQCFINGQFVDAEDGETYATGNPADGTVSDHSRGERDSSSRSPSSPFKPMPLVTPAHSALTLAIMYCSRLFFFFTSVD